MSLTGGIGSVGAEGSPAPSLPHGPQGPGGAGQPSFQAMWKELAPIGRHPESGGYRRYAWTGADADCRVWFREQAEARGLGYEVDRNGNQWAWLGDPLGDDAVVTGSHLDSVPDGGAFDGPLGVVSSFAALDELRRRGAEFTRPFAITNFGDEEGARFGLACVGSRLAAGQLTVEKAHQLRDGDGVTLPQAMEAAGYDPGDIGPDPERLARIGAFVELHVEQGRSLDLTGDPVGIASAIWPHGRWRFDFRGEANHAGTTRLVDRRDPMLTYAETVLAARREAEPHRRPRHLREDRRRAERRQRHPLPRPWLARFARRRPGHPRRRRHRHRAGRPGARRACGHRSRCRTGVLHARRGVPARPA